MKRDRISRRCFVKSSTAVAACLTSTRRLLADMHGAAPSGGGNALRIPPAYTGGMLTAESKKIEIWPGFQTDLLALNGNVPAPTIRIMRGGTFSAHVMNILSEPLVLHWHGILAPARLDGHPRDAVAAGASYMVNFPVNQRGGTYWYHAHTDLLTGKQIYQGIAGLFIVEEEHEIQLGLPRGDHDIPLIIADKRPDAMKQLFYAPTAMEVATGFLGNEILVNGTANAALSVDRGLYRLRLVNASNARVLKVGLSDDKTFHLIGSDAGLLPRSIEIKSLMLPPGARAEILMNFATYTVGSSVTLQSHEFQPPTGGHGGHGAGTGPIQKTAMNEPVQGTEMDILKFTVDRTVVETPSVPTTLVPLEAYDPLLAKRTRTFSLGTSGADKHQINGMSFAMERVDFTVPKGELEIWEFTDTTGEFHPMHPHGAHFQVLSRSSALAVPPEDTGWKDTVLVGPLETVRIGIKFDAHDGIFVHHCHNLEHEDDGMMQNFQVEAGAVVDPKAPALRIERMGNNMLHISWPSTAQGYRLQTSRVFGNRIEWEFVSQMPESEGGQLSVMIEANLPATFFRLVKL